MEDDRSQQGVLLGTTALLILLSCVTSASQLPVHACFTAAPCAAAYDIGGEPGLSLRAGHRVYAFQVRSINLFKMWCAREDQTCPTYAP